MDLRSKLIDPRHSVSLYGTTPPRAGASEEHVATAAGRLAERIRGLPLDGLVVYDVQDESDRTAAPRPFPFLPTGDPRAYARRLRDLTGRPAIVYTCIAGMTEATWPAWLTEARRDYGVDYLSLVGLPAARGRHSAIALTRAIQMAAAHEAGFTLGGVVIAERHTPARSESQRVIHKAEAGCRFFISQAVYHAETTIRLLADYARDCRERGVAPRRVVLTFVPCGREKTLAFIRWLGVAIADATARAILDDPAPLSRSIDICRANLRAILEQDYGRTLPLGLNVESVSIYRDEIDASIDLFWALHEVWQEAG